MRRIPLSQGAFSLVDDKDYESISRYKWYCARPNKANICYAQRSVKVQGKYTTTTMHRFLLGITDPSIHIDHKNSNGLDNRRQNLRICNPSENGGNRRKLIRKSSIYKGVHRADRSKWRAHITYKGKTIDLGIFSSEVDAAKAYDQKSLQLFQGFAKINLA